MKRFAKVEYEACWVYPDGERSDVFCSGTLSEVKAESKLRTQDDLDTIHIYKECYVINEDWRKWGNKYDKYIYADSILVGKVEHGKFHSHTYQRISIDIR
ncbi:MAG: hypothetical protein FWF59_02600 [Turicibacter sp.]|nr:hypothetical protein [Turicibacter sp.]